MDLLTVFLDVGSSILTCPSYSGQHIRTLFCLIPVEYLKNYRITQSLALITSNNTMMNCTMVWTIASPPDLDFCPENQLFGCIARHGLSVFGVVGEPDEQEIPMNTMDISYLAKTPDDLVSDISSMYHRVHGLVVYV